MFARTKSSLVTFRLELIGPFNGVYRDTVILYLPNRSTLCARYYPDYYVIYLVSCDKQSDYSPNLNYSSDSFSNIYDIQLKITSKSITLTGEHKRSVIPQQHMRPLTDSVMLARTWANKTSEIDSPAIIRLHLPLTFSTGDDYWGYGEMSGRITNFKHYSPRSKYGCMVGGSTEPELSPESSLPSTEKSKLITSARGSLKIVDTAGKLLAKDTLDIGLNFIPPENRLSRENRQSSKPTTAENQQPTAAENQQPTAAANQQPTAAANQQPPEAANQQLPENQQPAENQQSPEKPTQTNAVVGVDDYSDSIDKLVDDVYSNLGYGENKNDSLESRFNKKDPFDEKEISNFRESNKLSSSTKFEDFVLFGVNLASLGRLLLVIFMLMIIFVLTINLFKLMWRSIFGSSPPIPNIIPSST